MGIEVQNTYQPVVQAAEFQKVRHRGLMERYAPGESRTEVVLAATALLGRFWQVINKKRRKTSFTVLFFSSRGVPAPSSLRMTRLRLKALT